MSKQYGSKTMFEQSIVYLFNDYRRDGLSVEEASLKVTEDIEEIYHKYLERTFVKETDTLISPITKIEKALRTISDAKSISIHDTNLSNLRDKYKLVLRSVEIDLNHAKQQLKR